MAGRDRGGGGRNRFDDDDEETHVYCFVPGEGIDVVVLAAYLKRWIDGTATIQPSRHPKDHERIGFTVGASSTLNREALEDLITDTRRWYKEQQSRDFRRSPYDYTESDTFSDRKKRGPSAGTAAVKLTKPRDRQRPTTEGQRPTTEGQRPAAEPAARGRHTETEPDNPPSYNQTQYDRGRSRSASPPVQPDPDSFARQLSLSDERNQPNQGARVQPTTTNRHGTGTTTTSTTNRGEIKYVLKSSDNNNNNNNTTTTNNSQQPKKGNPSRHGGDEKWH